MSCVEVSTQSALDAAAKKGDCAHVRGTGYFRAYGSAQVTASDSAQVTAYGSAQVTASDSAQVRAYGSAQVRAYGSAQVTAGAYNAVTVHGVRTKVTGGVLITLPEITTAEAWCDFYGVDVVDGVATLFKAVSAAYVSPHGFDYTPGTTPVAPDWDGGRKECGGGLHFSPRPIAALRFFDEGFATKFVACPVRVVDIVVHHPAEYPDKIKAPGCCGPVVECDINGDPLPVAVVAS